MMHRRATSGRDDEAGRMSERATVPAVAGVVLAAGRSSRMGRNKLLFDVDGEPLVRRTVGRALEAGLAPVLVVLGFEAERVGAALAGLPIREVLNRDFDVGINSSVKRGLAAVPADCDAAVVILGDMPFVTAPMLAELVRRHRATGSPLVLSIFGEVQAPPTLYGRGLFDEFGTDVGEGCGKRVVRRHGAEAVRISWPAESLADIDAPGDYVSVATRVAGVDVAREDD
jgi:molybdenum cofactor cytidylyltransferase